jgi:hypothetical protein
MNGTQSPICKELHVPRALSSLNQKEVISMTKYHYSQESMSPEEIRNLLFKQLKEVTKRNEDVE